MVLRILTVRIRLGGTGGDPPLVQGPPGTPWFILFYAVQAALRRLKLLFLLLVVLELRERTMFLSVSHRLQAKRQTVSQHVALGQIGVRPVSFLEEVLHRKSARCCVLGWQREGRLVEGLMLLEGLAAHGRLSAGVGVGGRSREMVGIAG